MPLNRPLDRFLELTRSKLEDSYVHITIHNVSGNLLKEFMQKVVKPNYPGGISPAIKDLMRKAVKEEEKEKKKLKFNPSVHEFHYPEKDDCLCNYVIEDFSTNVI